MVDLYAWRVSLEPAKAYHNTMQNGRVRVCKSSGCTEASAVLVGVGDRNGGGRPKDGSDDPCPRATGLSHATHTNRMCHGRHSMMPHSHCPYFPAQHHHNTTAHLPGWHLDYPHPAPAPTTPPHPSTVPSSGTSYSPTHHPFLCPSISTSRCHRHPRERWQWHRPIPRKIVLAEVCLAQLQVRDWA